MVSLLKLASINERGVEFEDPKNPGSMMLLTPEESIRSQNAIGSDIMMQLDDVVSSCEGDKKRVEEATHRTTRWLDRCIAAHENPERQNLFAIVQGGLHKDLREISLRDLKARGSKIPGYAIGGLSGGESKSEFWRVVSQCTDETERPAEDREQDEIAVNEQQKEQQKPVAGDEVKDTTVGLPRLKPRYCMGVGYSLDIVVCVALGVDMFDCVYPCRTARFGTALTRKGQLRLSSTKKYQNDLRVIEEGCDCYTCSGLSSSSGGSGRGYSRSFLASVVAKNEKSNPVGATLLTIHNLRFMMRLMSEMREAIKNHEFSEWVIRFLKEMFCSEREGGCESANTEGGRRVDVPPLWVRDALGPEGANIRGIEEAFDWANGTPSAEDMPKQ
eukprot:g4673.t1